MGKSKITIRLALSVCLLALAACSGGGGGGTSPAVTPPPVNPIPPPVTPSSIGSAQQAYLGGIPLPQADASTAAFANTGLPVNVAFPLLESVLQTDVKKLTGIQLTDGATLTRTGTATYSGRPTAVYDLKIPGLGVVATGLFSDGTLVHLADGRLVSADLTGLNYSMLGTWMVEGTGPSFQQAIVLTGYQSAAKNLPTAGAATYIANSPLGAGAGRTVGLLFTSDSAVRTGTLQGSATMTLEFSNNSVNGSLNLTATELSSNTTASWNTVNLSGSLVGVNLVGKTSTSGTPASSLAFGSTSTGNFNGSLFGPNAEEAGVVWTLHDPSGIGKTAVGAFLATKQ
jgi:hypothetical protein